jgi:hypothetical protein
MADFSPTPSVIERDLQFQQALADSARDLSVDERYVLRRLASIVAQTPPSTKYAEVPVNLPVSEFAVHAGLTWKVAFRRLDVATHSIFHRHVRQMSSDGCETVTAWAGTLHGGEDSFTLSFTGFFVQHLISVLRPVRIDEILGYVDFAKQVAAPAVLCRGAKQPYGLPVVLTSRLKARTKRPKGMSMSRLLDRVGKRFKGTLDEDELWDVLDMVLRESPWRDKDDSRYYKYTHRDMKKVHQWIIENMNGPGCS